MAGNIRLEVVTPQKEVVKEETQIVVAPGVLGEFGVLIGHTPFMTALNVGTIRYTDAQGQENSVFVSGGFAEALPDKVTVLAESAEKSQDIDVDRAKAAMDRAQKRIDDKSENIDYVRAKMALKRALHRIQLAEGRRI
jgi:F-type H+-transporting ATPase subunit epsilon